jgi:AhpC/TSA family
MKRPSSVLAIAVILTLGACSGEVSGDPPDRGVGSTPAEDEGDNGGNRDANAAADFSFETFEGETFSLAEQRGTPVVLNFWESW